MEVALLDDEATLSIDTSGAGLHRRGYRKLAGPAQIRETLAAALVQLSFWEAGRPLLDPFCGSGTIVIEAALLGRNLAPGRKRTFAAEHWPPFAAGTCSKKIHIRQENLLECLLVCFFILFFICWLVWINRGCEWLGFAWSYF